ncbi:hypothetical protein [Kocuria rhizophila]|uniref:hypothetical protein n=1 Tax=Kocuria rhizophila TaxID=72000 RepID=UPI001EF704F9|nr:hypothetical protein [Kocuria rhizophila]MCG7424610.1 hypothetical protein [Kocuria rhizophila]MCT1879866.1 hypothetical protein [Kocuria rhizophila]WSY88691.1 hypothetical protein OH783_01535 [Kocuria rhizophila]WSZ54119.1 hypothetical protein OG926_01540 [Kocuria rhizophila]
MLGAEGVKNLVIDRLAQVVPVSLRIRREIVGATVGELPDVQAYFPGPQDHEQVEAGLWPFVTVHVDDTPGEVSNVAPPSGSDEVVQEYQLEYNVLVGVNAWSGVPGDPGAFAARLQAERLALACREALLQDRDLQGPAVRPGEDEWVDWASVNYDRWVEDYGVYASTGAGAWIGQALLKVPVLAHEYLDRSPYMDNRMYMITAFEVAQADPVTGAIIPETVTDRVDGAPEPRP